MAFKFGDLETPDNGWTTHHPKSRLLLSPVAGVCPGALIFDDRHLLNLSLVKPVHLPEDLGV